MAFFKDAVIGKFVGGFFGAVGACAGALAFEHIKRKMAEDQKKEVAVKVVN